MSAARLWQEGVEAQDELAVAVEQLLDTLDDTLSVNPARPWSTSAAASRPPAGPAGSAAGPAGGEDARPGRRRRRTLTARARPCRTPPGTQARSPRRAKHTTMWPARPARPCPRPRRAADWHGCAPLRLKLLHNLEERVVGLLVVLEANLDVAQVRQRIVGRQPRPGPGLARGRATAAAAQPVRFGAPQIRHAAQRRSPRPRAHLAGRLAGPPSPPGWPRFMPAPPRQQIRAPLGCLYAGSRYAALSQTQPGPQRAVCSPVCRAGSLFWQPAGCDSVRPSEGWTSYTFNATQPVPATLPC